MPNIDEPFFNPHAETQSKSYGSEPLDYLIEQFQKQAIVLRQEQAERDQVIDALQAEIRSLKIKIKTDESLAKLAEDGLRREFMECDTCRDLCPRELYTLANPGTPPLCKGCLHNREAIHLLQEDAEQARIDYD